MARVSGLVRLRAMFWRFASHAANMLALHREGAARASATPKDQCIVLFERHCPRGYRGDAEFPLFPVPVIG